ncbi:MAG: hypothetical protein DDG59_05000 [Anaerolineae bacterium]|nr:MAG: hypothetical protein DDG59_05000 [Anaerolineae bacterium]
MVWSDFFSSYAALLGFIPLALLWSLGGYLSVRSVFCVSARESLVSGIGLGSVLVIVLTNLASHWLSLQWSYLLATLFVIGIAGVGVRFANPRQAIFESWQQSLPPFFVFLFLFVLFLKINQGLAIFDENYNLPIISRMAAGDVPPHFPFDPNRPLAYHYGFHLMAALFVNFAQLAPWSAFDVVRALSHALMLVLAALWLYRQTQSLWASVLGAGLIYLAGSTQWLLVFLPLPWLERINQSITLTNTALESGSTLYEVLLSQWKIDGLGPISYPFAFVNALFKPQTLALTSNGSFVGLALCLFLLLEASENQFLRNLLLGLCLGCVALTAEYLFGMVALGSLMVVMVDSIRNRSLRFLSMAAQIWLPAILLALTSGGVLTVLFQRTLAGVFGQASLESCSALQFAWTWPPSLSTLYFGKLSFFHLPTLLFILILIGPLLAVFPLSTKRLRSHTAPPGFLEKSILFGAWLSFVTSLFIGIADSVGGITRLFDTALFSLLILSVPSLYSLWKRQHYPIQLLLVIWAVVLSMSGIVTFGVNLVAIARPVTTYYIQGLDLMFYQKYWNRLKPNAQVFDPNPARAMVVFGRPSGVTAADYGRWLPEWEEMVARPDPYQLAAAGYTHAYIARGYWSKLDKGITALWQQACVKLVEERTFRMDYRRLYDITACR